MKYLSVCLLFYSLNICHAAPEIKVDGKQTIDFGTFPANKKQTTVFVLKNTGDKDLQIINIRKTCGCSATRLSQKLIPPGKSATLEADIKAQSIAGPFSKNLYVESNAGNLRFLRLTLSGKSVPLIKVFPKEFLYMGTLTPGKSQTFSFKLETSQENVKLQLLPAEANFPSQVFLKKAKAKEFLLTITASPKMFKKLLNCEIEIAVSSPEGWEPVKIKLMGQTAAQTNNK
ncbi:MAG: DUF1573 domain-containing protein [Victivallaceae bacterium]|nr:DUF1573 domain-containing protein [Victivallaceae bacterium]